MPCCVLVVDDDHDNREMLAEYLRYCGFEVGTARDGDDAVHRARALRPQVILMDIAMPGIDGCEATRRIKADPKTRDAVVYAVTGLVRSGERQSALDAGCDRIVTKPFDVSALAIEISRMFKRVARSAR